jgi:hypothetical protein
LKVGVLGSTVKADTLVKLVGAGFVAGEMAHFRSLLVIRRARRSTPGRWETWRAFFPDARR